MKHDQIGRAVLARYVNASDHKASIALMAFLSAASRKLGVADHVYVVGGAVRNFVLDPQGSKMPIKDIDVVIDSVALRGRDSEWYAQRIRKLIPAKTSLTTNQYGVAILAVQGPWIYQDQDLTGEVIEIANARKESYGGTSGKGYKPSDVSPATIQEDVVRREFSFNTLLWSMAELAKGPDKAEILDITGCGLRDLRDGVMNCPSDPDKTFSDDPTRILRAVKFMIRYGFTIGGPTKAALMRNAPKLQKAPPNAIATILIEDILRKKQAKETLQALVDLKIMAVIREMVLTNKAFRQTLVNWVRKESKVNFLFDLMDVGLPGNAKIGFLTPKQQARLREISLAMPDTEAQALLATLKQPTRVLDTKALADEFSLRGPDFKLLIAVARGVILDDPKASKHALQKEVRKRMRASKGR